MRARRVVGALAAGAVVALSSGAGASTTVALAGSGIDGHDFGRPATRVVAALTSALGRATRHATPDEVGCGVTSTESWGTLTIDVRGTTFVGYSDGPTGWGVPAMTSRGLRLGATVAHARSLYPELRTSSAQGGSYRVATGSGTIAGFLSAEPSSARATIASIGAGDQGCPAMSP